LTRGFGAATSAGQLTLTACVVGLGLGQLAIGPLSDRLGRRPPLLAGLAVYCAVSLACAAASSIWLLVLLRLLQGLSGAAGIVVARSIVRDLVSGAAAARLYSVLMLVVGVVPVLAPVLGGALLHVTTWRGLFVVLAVVVACILAATALWLRETLPPERRTAGGTRAFGTLLRDRSFLVYALVPALAFGALFSYIAGSSFVLEDIYSISPQRYGAIFGLNALGIVACSQLNRMLLGRTSPERILFGGAVAQASAGAALLAFVLAGAGLPGVLPCLFVVVASIGLIVPNATALALEGYPHLAGSASALLGALQFLLGAAVAPLVGVAGGETAVPMAAMIAAFSAGGLSVAVVAHERRGAARARPA
jgi:DHA1 family bicyclomycin/chloramphenicol resistance-like MFS transporter